MIAEIRIDEKENSFYCGESFIEGMNAIICSDGRESGVHSVNVKAGIRKSSVQPKIPQYQ
ncbi:hypothetical protein SFC52_06255 [Niallia circulans]|uniref:hypothetical protein n=1 Tax=Niallia circulans TaxID=1397 RepID=UPI00397D18B3